LEAAQQLDHTERGPQDADDGGRHGHVREPGPGRLVDLAVAHPARATRDRDPDGADRDEPGRERDRQDLEPQGRDRDESGDEGDGELAALPREGGALGRPARPRAAHRCTRGSTALTPSTRPTTTAPPTSQGRACGRGRGSSRRRARSVAAHEASEEIARAAPPRHASTATASSSTEKSAEEATVVSATPPAIRARAVRTHARAVRWLASEDCTSGSRPTPYT